MKACRRKRIKCIGVIHRKEIGRPELVYGRWCRQDQMEHQVRITDFALLFIDSPLTLGVKVGKTEADALMVRDGINYWVEIDNSAKMADKQMQAKWPRYKGADGFILVVTVTETRMQKLRKHAEQVKDKALFSTFERLQSGMDKPWVDFDGKTEWV